MNSSHVTDNPWKPIISQAVNLYERLSAHPHYETHEIEVDGERRQAHRLHSMPHVALLEDTLAVRQQGMSVHTVIDHVAPDPDLRLGIVQGINHVLQHVAIPTQQQYH